MTLVSYCRAYSYAVISISISILKTFRSLFYLILSYLISYHELIKSLPFSPVVLHSRLIQPSLSLFLSLRKNTSHSEYISTSTTVGLIDYNKNNEYDSINNKRVTITLLNDILRDESEHTQKGTPLIRYNREKRIDVEVDTVNQSVSLIMSIKYDLF